jgi:hypothetical protein
MIMSPVYSCVKTPGGEVHLKAIRPASGMLARNRGSCVGAALACRLSQEGEEGIKVDAVPEAIGKID